MSTAKEIINALKNEDYVEADSLFEEAMAEKALPKLDNLRKNVAKKKFSK
jgi:hypothetical protein